jgi:hypothetical protein
MSNIRVYLYLLNIVSVLRSLYLYRTILTVNTLTVYPESTMSLHNDILMNSSPVFDGIVARWWDKLTGVAHKRLSVRKGLNLPAILPGKNIPPYALARYARSSHGFTPRKCRVDGICASFSALHSLILPELPFNDRIKVNRGTVLHVLHV